MAWKPLHRCNYPACTTSTAKRFCNVHTSEKSEHDKLYTTYAWTKARKEYLATHLWCVCTRYQCGHDPKLGCLDQTTAIIDHIVPRTKGGSTWDRSNWQRLCKLCHDRKTMHEVRNGIA